MTTDDYTPKFSSQQVIVFQPDSDHPVNLHFDDRREIWATQKEIAEMFGLDVSGVSRHIQNFKKQRGESANQGIARYAIPTAGGVQMVEHYNHKVITFVGYNAKATERTLEFQDLVELLIEQAIQPVKAESSLQLARFMLEAMENQERRLNEHDERLLAIESHIQPESEHYTVVGYFRKRGLPAPSRNQAQSIGQHAARLSRDRGQNVGKTSDPSTLR